MSRLLRIAVLVCHTIPDAVARERGAFDRIFAAWLDTAVQTRNAKCDEDERVALEISAWNVVEGAYPPSLDHVDALIVTGSAASAYDEEPWIRRLSDYLTDVYHHHMSVRIFGGCFGHQIVAQTLLQHHGVCVEKNPQGWEIGVHAITVQPDFAAQFPDLIRTPRLAMQYLHADHVTATAGLPPGWIAIGSTPLCGLQGLLEPGRVLTYQGHPEFDAFINHRTVDDLAGQGTIASADQPRYAALTEQEDDRALAGEVALDFFLS